MAGKPAAGVIPAVAVAPGLTWASAGPAVILAIDSTCHELVAEFCASDSEVGSDNLKKSCPGPARRARCPGPGAGAAEWPGRGPGWGEVTQFTAQ
jgi:hypothetical protein